MEFLKRIYAAAAIVILNTLIAFTALNLLLAVAYLAWDGVKGARKGDARVSAYRERFTDYEAYSQLSHEDAVAMLDEQDAMGAIGLRYRPWVQFGNPSVQGRFLNTNENGFRATRLPESRPGLPIKIHVFGGSTTFGYGVADQHTIPSYLQLAMERKLETVPFQVKNFGQAFYYSSQEQLLFLTTLKEGDVPDWAVFIDGGNDTAQLALRHDEPIFTPGALKMWEAQSRGTGTLMTSLLTHLPMARLVAKFVPRPDSDPNQHRLIMTDANVVFAQRQAMADYVVTRYLMNVRSTRAVCREHRVQCLFVWQPHPGYKYDRRLHKTFPWDGPVPDYFTLAFKLMEDNTATDQLNLGALLESTQRKSYVDDVHYNESTNQEIAERIAAVVSGRMTVSQ